jgi:hypothetical protein
VTQLGQCTEGRLHGAHEWRTGSNERRRCLGRPAQIHDGAAVTDPRSTDEGPAGDLPRQRKGLNPFLADAPVRKPFSDEGVERCMREWMEDQRMREGWRDGDTNTYRYRANLMEAVLVRWSAARTQLAAAERNHASLKRTDDHLLGLYRNEKVELQSELRACRAREAAIRQLAEVELTGGAIGFARDVLSVLGVEQAGTDKAEPAADCTCWDQSCPQHGMRAIDAKRALEGCASHPDGCGEHCEDCDRAYADTLWWAPDGLWSLLVSPYGAGLLCPACFSKRARARGLTLRFHPVVVRDRAAEDRKSADDPSVGAPFGVLDQDGDTP